MPDATRGRGVVVVAALAAISGAGLLGYSALHRDSSPPPSLSTAAPSTPGSSAPGSSTPGGRSATSSARGCVPTSIVARSIEVNEPVKALGLNAQGQIYPPPHTTMWYDKSPQPGTDGISVIAGHVTYDGPDNFYRLRDLSVGEKVELTCSGGRTMQLVVTSSASVTKVAATTDQRIWGGSDTPVIALITCDIKSKVVAGHHLNNYVVWTKPVQ